MIVHNKVNDDLEARLATAEVEARIDKALLKLHLSITRRQIKDIRDQIHWLKEDFWITPSRTKLAAMEQMIQKMDQMCAGIEADQEPSR